MARGERSSAGFILLGLTLRQATGAGVHELLGKQVCAPMGRWRDASRARHIPEAGAGADGGLRAAAGGACRGR